MPKKAARGLQKLTLGEIGATVGLLVKTNFHRFHPE